MVKEFFQDLSLTPRLPDPVEIMRDSTAAIQFGRDPKFHRKTTHIKRHYHFVQNAIKDEKVVIKYVFTSKMIADPLTKAIPRDAFKAHVASLGLRRT